MNIHNLISTKQVSRSLSRQEIFDVIRHHPLMSRNELAEKVSVSRATVSGIVGEFLDAGLIEEVGEGKSSGGRPPINFQYRPESRNAVGVVLLDNEIRGTLTDLEGNPIKTCSIPFTGISPQTMLDATVQIVEMITRDISKEKIVGLGVGVPGIVQANTGEILLSVSKGWLDENVPVKEILEQRLRMAVFVANRSRIAALGELKAGIGKDVKNLIYLFLGQGISAGIVLDGRLYFGPGSCAGEIGHISMDPDGPLCRCGNHGCLEVYATESAILAQIRSLARTDPNSPLASIVNGRLESISMDDILTACNSGDQGVMKVFESVGKIVGRALAILINLFNPEMVILGGPIGSSAKNLILEPARQEAIQRSLPISLQSTEIVTGILGTEATTIGAAVFALNQTTINEILGEALEKK